MPEPVEQLNRLKAALADRYTIEGELGHGGMATVYLAEDLKHERKVAIKVLRPELAAVLGVERFLNEIRMTAGLHHPHILPLLDSGVTDALLYYVMPYVDGESLRDRLNREKQLGVDEAIKVAREIADALDSAHRHHIVHRDIKPENILLEEGHAVLADFGIARAVDLAGGERITETGTAVGTPHYMSPEQAGADREVDGRSDLYSLGCVLHEMLAGLPPFTGVTAQSILHQHLAAAPVPVSDLRPNLPSNLVETVEKSLAKTPGDRYATGSEFADALDAPRQQPAAERRPGPNWARRLGAAAAVGIAVAVSVLAIQRLAPTAPDRGAAADAAPGVAVLPFRVSGTGLELWREGMVDLLSTKLDGVGNLRGIHSATVMARWREEVGDNEDPDLATMLRAATRSDARWAVTGNALTVGSDIRLTATLHDLESGRTIGASVEAEGPADQILDLSDDLTVRIAQQLLAGDTSIAARLGPAAVPLTSSPEALRAYLEGEAHWRRFQWANAIDAYQRAVDIDSTFALAYLQLHFAAGWELGGAPAEFQERAMRYIGRLPERDRLRARAIGGGGLQVLGELRRAVRRYPDDPDLWERLGETYLHTAGEPMVSLEEVERVYSRAVTLNPGFAPYYLHLMDAVINLGDSARAYELLEYETQFQASTSAAHRAHAVAVPLVFGDSASRETARAAYDTVPSMNLVFFSAPHTLDALEFRHRWSRRQPTANGRTAAGLVATLINRGKVQEALAQLDDPLLTEFWDVLLTYFVYMAEIPLPRQRLTILSDLGLSSVGPYRTALMVGAYAADQGRWDDHALAVLAVQDLSGRYLADGDSLRWGWSLAIADALRGYGLWKQGEHEQALLKFASARPALAENQFYSLSWIIRFWTAQLHVESGDLQEAIRFYESLWFYAFDFTYRYYLLGALYEQVGEPQKARVAYENFLIAWDEADPDLEQLEVARQALARLHAALN